MGFSTGALKDYEPLLHKRVAILVEELEKRAKGSSGPVGGSESVVDLSHWMSAMA